MPLGFHCFQTLITKVYYPVPNKNQVRLKGILASIIKFISVSWTILTVSQSAIMLFWLIQVRMAFLGALCIVNCTLHKSVIWERSVKKIINLLCVCVNFYLQFWCMEKILWLWLLRSIPGFLKVIRIGNINSDSQ